VDVQNLFDFAEREVPEIVRNSLGGVQKPEHFSTGSATFPVGLVTDAEKKEIILAAPRRQILRPREFHDHKQDFDSLVLTPLVQKLLAEQNGTAVRGAGSQTWYIPADNLPGAFVPTGGYDIDVSGHVTVSLKLLADGKLVGSALVSGTKNKLADLAQAVVEKIDELVLKH
jgi:hypothetical protein